MGKIETLLDDALANKTNLIIIGPNIGKSSRIENWAKEKGINTFDYLPWRSNKVYEESTTDGILVIDSQALYDTENVIPGVLSKFLSNPADIKAEFTEYGKHREPNILFTVVVLSSDTDYLPFLQPVKDMVSGKPNWEIKTLYYDKTDQLPYFIKVQDYIINNYLEHGTEICERINKELESFGFTDKRVTPEAKIILHTRLKRILTHLLESPDFETFLPDDRTRGLTNHAIHYALSFCETGTKKEFVSKLPRAFKALALNALSDYND